MIEHSDTYSRAIVADSRKQIVRAVFDLVDPDAQVDSVSTDDESVISLTEQVVARGKGESEQRIATLEANRWILDGSFEITPDDKWNRIGQVGWESESICDSNGDFSAPYPFIDVEISGTSILQAVTVVFSEKNFNGFAEDFTVELFSGDTLLDTKEVTGNKKEGVVVVDGFTVYYPTRIRLTIKKWSIPMRRVRVIRFMLGLYEEWETNIIQSVDVYTEVTFSGLKIPYSSCTIKVYNENHRFDPYAPDTIFASIEERQAIKIEFGLRLEDGEYEWLPGGTYYQQSAGWKLQDLTVSWDLLDIIGMLVKRKFVVPGVLPTTLEGWLAAIMASLGVNFANRYLVDDDVAGISLTATADKVAGKNCGEILRFLCMATNTWPRQDFSTGKLRVGKLEQLEGNRITLDNMPKYPEMSANDDIADITFQLDSGEVTFPGNNTESEVSLNVDNPFVHTEEDARKAVISCMFEYGGRSFSVTSRGNPSSECGDIQSVDTQFLSTISARLYKQQLAMDKGIMRNMPSLLVQSPNDSMYANKEVLTGTGTWTALADGPVKLTIISGGNGGMGGGGGNMHQQGWSSPEDTTGGIGGNGGKVFIIETTAIAGQTFDYSCGIGGAGGAGGAVGRDGQPGSEGTDTTFGVFSSANGTTYPAGIMDIQSGAVFAQKGGDYGARIRGLEGSGGPGGKQGKNGLRVTRINPETGESYVVTKSRPKAGEDGERGKDGCVIVEWGVL